MGDLIVAMSSVEKALTILMAFAPQNQEMGSAELGRMFGFSNSTVNRLLHVLESFDLIQQDPETKRFSLGRSAAAIGRAVSRSLSTQVVSIARLYCDNLRDEIGETVSLEVWSGSSTILAYEAQGPNPVSVLMNLRKTGEKFPVHVAAGAKAILAFSPSETVDHLIRGKLSRFTPNTITKPNIFKQQLREIRENGIALDQGEYNVEVHAIAAPIFNANKKPIAAIVIAVPFYRVKSHIESNAIAQLKETASKISARLLYSEVADEGKVHKEGSA